MESEQIKNAIRTKQKRRRREGRRVQGSDYNYDHDPSMWDNSARLASQMEAKRAPPAAACYEQCEVCEEWTNQHTGRKCPWEPKQKNGRTRKGPARKTTAKRAKKGQVQGQVREHPVCQPSLNAHPAQTPAPSSLSAFFPEGSLDDCTVIAGHHPDAADSVPCSTGSFRDWFE